MHQSENWTRRAFLAGFALSAVGNCAVKEVESRQRNKALSEQWIAQKLEEGRRQIPWWPGSAVVETSNTVFIQEKRFSPGQAFREQDPIFFPFIIRIDKEAVSAFRKEIVELVPQDTIIEIRATQPQRDKGEQTDQTGKPFSISVPFDQIVAEKVFLNFRDRNLQNKDTLKDFTREVNRALFWKVVEEINYASLTSKIEESSQNKNLELWKAAFSAIRSADVTSAQLNSPFVIEPIPSFNYANYYQEVINSARNVQ